MKVQKNKFDWNQPFVLLNNKSHFDHLPSINQATSNRQIFQQSQTQQYNKQSLQSRQYKNNIIVPPVQRAESNIKVKQFAKIPLNYIRLSPELNLPKVNSYQLSQIDLKFIQQNRQKYKYKGQIFLTQAFFRQIIIELEKKAGRYELIPKNKAWLTNFIERQHKELLKIQNYNSFAEEIYRYWKSRRQEFGYPLYRPLWKAKSKQTGISTVFKTREKETRNLRRSSRGQDYLLHDLAQQFDLARKIIDRISLREHIKTLNLQITIGDFYNEISDFVILNQFHFVDENFPDIRNEQLKNFQKLAIQTAKYKDKQSKLQISQQQQKNQNFDSKLSLANFIATVVHQAQSFGLDYQGLFQTKPALNKKRRARRKQKDSAKDIKIQAIENKTIEN